jgi:laccase
LNETRTKVHEYGTKVQLILQNTWTVNIENHPIHIHGTGNYDPLTAKFNLVDPPYMNLIGVPVGGWAAVRFVADNPSIHRNLYFLFPILFKHPRFSISAANNFPAPLTNY